jgi:hypothetical protein
MDVLQFAQERTVDEAKEIGSWCRIQVEAAEPIFRPDRTHGWGMATVPA